jgi:hypothetical protein
MGIVYSTVLDIITAGLRELAILRPDEVPKPAQAAVGVQRFNLLLDELSIGLANIFVEAQDSFTLQANKNPYAIGPGAADWNTAIPIQPTQAYITIAGVNYPIGVDMTEEEYNSIPIPTQQSQPTRIWFQPGAPTGKVWFDYFPDQNYPFVLFSFKAMTKAVDQNTSLAYPDGYESMLMYNFAVRSARSFGKSAPPETVKLAAITLSAIENLNASRTIEPAWFGDVPGRRKLTGNIFDMGMK